MMASDTGETGGLQCWDGTQALHRAHSPSEMKPAGSSPYGRRWQQSPHTMEECAFSCEYQKRDGTAPKPWLLRVWPTLAAPVAPMSLVIQMPRPLPGPAETESTIQPDLQRAQTYSKGSRSGQLLGLALMVLGCHNWDFCNRMSLISTWLQNGYCCSNHQTVLGRKEKEKGAERRIALGSVKKTTHKFAQTRTMSHGNPCLQGKLWITESIFSWACCSPEQNQGFVRKEKDESKYVIVM